MKKKYLYIALFALIVIFSLALSACVIPQQDTPEKEEENETIVPFAFDKIVDMVNETTYVVYEDGIYYLATEEEGIFSRGFFAYDRLWTDYANCPECISIKLTAEGSYGFMQTDGILLSPLNSDGSDFAYEGYDSIACDVNFGRENYITFFLYNYQMKKGQLLNTENFNFAGDPYYIRNNNFNGDPLYGYAYLYDVNYNEEEKIYEWDSYVVNSKTGEKLLKVDSFIENNPNYNEEFGIDVEYLVAYETDLPATDTEPALNEYTIVSLTNLTIIATHVKSFYRLTPGTLFYGYTKDWNEDLYEFNKIYFVNRDLTETEFSADIFYSRDNLGDTNLKTDYSFIYGFLSNGFYVYQKIVTDTENPTFRTLDFYIAKLGESETFTVSADDGGRLQQFDGGVYIISNLDNPNELAMAYNTKGFSLNSTEPVFEYTLPFNTEENVYDAYYETAILSQEDGVAVTQLRVVDNSESTDYLYIKKAGSPVVIKELPKDVSAEFYYVESNGDVIVSLVETDTTHETGRDEYLCALWLPLKGDFNNNWHKSISLNYGKGLNFAIIEDFDRVSIVELKDNSSILPENSITPYLYSLTYKEALSTVKTEQINWDYTYYDTIDDRNANSNALVFSTDSEGYFNAYPLVDISIIITDEIPIYYNAIIYGEKDDTGRYIQKAFEMPDTTFCNFYDEIAIYGKPDAWGTQKVTITEKEEGGLEFSVYDSGYYYNPSFIFNGEHYYITENASLDLYGLENEEGETILIPQYDEIINIEIIVNGEEQMYLVVQKGNSPKLVKLVGNSVETVVDYGYTDLMPFYFGIVAILPNGIINLLDFDGKLIGEYDTAWFMRDLDYFALLNLYDNDFEEEPFYVESLAELSTYCEVNSKQCEAQTFILIYYNFYIVKDSEGYAFYSQDFSLRNFIDLEEIYGYGDRRMPPEDISPSNERIGFYAEAMAFLKDGKYIPVNFENYGEETPEIEGKWSEEDYRIFNMNFVTRRINYAV